MIFVITSQKHDGYIRAVITTFKNADEALDEVSCGERPLSWALKNSISGF